MCDDSIVGEQQKMLLRRICLKDANNVIFLRPYRNPLRTNDFNDVRIYIRDRNDKDVSFLTPVAAVTQRALSEFKEVERNNELHMPLKNTIKRGEKSRKLNRSTTGRRKGRKSHKQRKKPSINPKTPQKEENVKINQQKNINVKTKNRQETHILGETGQQKNGIPE